jgi:hypothetical protein
LQGSAGTASQASDYSHISIYTASLAWDGIKDGADGGNAWIDNNSGTDAWIMWTFPASKRLTGWRFQIRELDGTYDSWPSAVTWKGMVSGGSWGVDDVELFSAGVTDYATLTGGDWTAWHDFSSGAIGDFDLYRMEVDGIFNLNGTRTRVQIQEFEFLEQTAALENTYVDTAPFNMEFDAEATPMIPFKINSGLLATAAEVLTIPRTRQFYRVWITGAADGLSNLEVVASSVQCRARSGDPTFISVSIPAFSYATAIAARSNGQVVVEIVYTTAAGVVLQAEEIARADISDIQTHEGGTSRSIIVEARSTTTHAAKAVALSGVVYRRLAYGRTSLRFAKPDPYLRPGDTVTTDLGDSVEVDAITYTLSPRNMTMELSEA